MKSFLLALLGLITFANLLAMLMGDDLDCDCLDELDV